MPPEEWSIGQSAPSCTGCGKVFVPKDVRFSALYKGEAKLVRKDYCPACWAKTERGSEISFWKGTVPEPEEGDDKKKRRAKLEVDAETLFEILKTNGDSPDPARRRFRFVVALLLVRKKKLKLSRIERRTTQDGHVEDVLILARTGRGAGQVLEVADVKMSEQEMLAAQEEVEHLIAGAEVPPALPAEGGSV